jgi:hypothetical protein
LNLWNFCPCWPWTLILQILVIQIARITDLIHWYPA